MELNELSIEIVKSIRELNLNSIAEVSAQVGMANFIYLLECLKKDFSKMEKKENVK